MIRCKCIKQNVCKQAWAFKKVIIDIRVKYIHKKSYKVSFKAKWVTKEVTKCRRLKNKAWKLYVKLKTIESYDNYKEKLRKAVTLNKAAHFDFDKRLSENIVNNSKCFYSYVKSKQRCEDKIEPMKMIEGK